MNYYLLVLKSTIIREKYIEVDGVYNRNKYILRRRRIKMLLLVPLLHEESPNHCNFLIFGVEYTRVLRRHFY